MLNFIDIVMLLYNAMFSAELGSAIDAMKF